MRDKMKKIGGVLVVFLTVSSTILSIVEFKWGQRWIQIIVNILSLYTIELALIAISTIVIILTKKKPNNAKISISKRKSIHVFWAFNIMIILAISPNIIKYEKNKARLASYVAGPVSIKILCEKGSIDSAIEHAKVLQNKPRWKIFSKNLENERIEMKNKNIMMERFRRYYSANSTNNDYMKTLEMTLVGLYYDMENEYFKDQIIFLKSSDSEKMPRIWERYVRDSIKRKIIE